MLCIDFRFAGPAADDNDPNLGNEWPKLDTAPLDDDIIRDMGPESPEACLEQGLA